MNLDEVPQEGNATLGGQRKAMLARDANGRLVLALSRGWEAEEIVTMQVVQAHAAEAEAARADVIAGRASPLAYWMHARRMDVATLAQTSGVWAWRVRRHLRPEPFARLGAAVLARYAQALGLAPDELRSLPAAQQV